MKRLARPIVRLGNPILRPPEGRSLRNGPSVNGTQKQYAFTARKRYFASPAPFSSISFPARGKRYGPRSGRDGAPNHTAPPAHSNAGLKCPAPFGAQNAQSCVCIFVRHGRNVQSASDCALVFVKNPILQSSAFSCILTDEKHRQGGTVMKRQAICSLRTRASVFIPGGSGFKCHKYSLSGSEL